MKILTSLKFSKEFIMHKHWGLVKDTNAVAWLTLDKQNTSVNSLNKEVLEELSAILSILHEDKTLRTLVITSAKKTGFIAGADISQFEHLENSDEAMQLIRQGQLIFEKLSQLPFPSIALIRGFCLGGGLELALACTYRIANDDIKTRIGLPEVLLGIHPGWGGTVRLPRLIGAPQALDLILSGKTLPAVKAAKLGILDEAVPERQLMNAVDYYIKKTPPPHTTNIFQRFTNQNGIRPLLGKWVNYQLEKKIRRDQYPAPFKALETWVKNGVDNPQAFVEEARSLSELIVTDTSRNLVHVFHLQELLKSQAKKVDVKPQHVHVIGAGAMGGDIAAWCALRGLTVTLQDREARFIAPAIGRAYDLFSKRLKISSEIQAAMDRLTPDIQGKGVSRADIIIEAIFENLEAKQNLFQSIEQHCKPSALLASNTSSIPLDEINQVLQQPERLVGIHFFNPVAMMKLVEVIHGEKTSEDVLNQALAFVKQIDRLPLSVESHPGFLVNRVLMPYLMESILLLEEKIPAEVIDEAAIRFGMPMGPIELGDTVGLDICLSVAKNLTHYFGGTVPKILEEKINHKQLGKKSKQGFYRYQNGKKISRKTNFDDYDLETIQSRLILRMLNEAVACLREKIVATPQEIDAGMIFGTGFAPFRGGPLHYAENTGYKKIRDKLFHYEQTLGPRFTPDEGWNNLISSSQEEETAAA